MNNILKFLDYKKVIDEMYKSLENELASSDLMFIQLITILEIKEGKVILGIPSKATLDMLIQRRIDQKIIDFLKLFIFNGQSLELAFEVVEIEKEENTYLGEVSKNNFKNKELENLNSSLKSDFTFDTFVMGGSNRYAYEVSKAIAKSPGVNHNPLFIYGGVGLGKTHLLHAIGNEITKNFPDKIVRYVTSETLLNEFVDAVFIKKNTTDFRKIREVDVLLVDDIQFLSNKDSFQEEFYHIFNSLSDLKKQIVLAADKTPPQIIGLQDRLLSRFQGGYLADIKPPDLETRMAIIKNLAITENFKIDNEHIEYLAKSISSNVRDIRGAFVKLASLVSFHKKEIDHALIQEAICSFNNSRPKLTVKTIKKVVANEYEISVDELVSENRKKTFAFPRQVAMYIMRELTDMTLQDIGLSFGKKDHGTVLHAIDRINIVIAKSESENIRILELKKKLENSYER